MSEKLHLLIVGASSGLGKEMAAKFSARYHISAIARRADKLAELTEFNVDVYPFDVCDFDDIPKLMKQIVAKNGKLMHLIYCAGLQSILPIKFSKPEAIEKVMKVNYLGALFFAKSFANNKFSKNNASYTAISSIAAELAEPGIINYSASKAALNQMIKGLAKECAPRRFNAVAPGFLKTEMTRNLGLIYNDDFIAECEKNYPLGLGATSDICNAVEFLISDKASYITGQILTVDGGGGL
jgi:gluconate 5-dehydrogenase